MELHEAKEGGKSYYRIYTHYGRTDDIGGGSGGGEQTYADAQFEFRQCRYLNSLQQANVRLKEYPIYGNNTFPNLVDI